MKKLFETPEMEVVKFSVEDVITASGGNGSSGGEGGAGGETDL